MNAEKGFKIGNGMGSRHLLPDHIPFSKRKRNCEPLLLIEKDITYAISTPVIL